ncbi:unnamed protein product (macronuclear) [Paramecium tetraurelia]|uniref:ADP-ribosylation factor n=1 Tax=Paramecium tetraurelia TaxID=5888 RepID=A0D2W0_PARTE|nr:uncharacterized protein GSPATT00039204001 [Paramecium tetraurelia]CAK77377.1 unnamed protein product [Paramecium tetraurelia]|eukprot:XP_001444774.1 hypothetical protein (macronuclear) [Paramecium tetraurelia strain d4-2]
MIGLDAAGKTTILNRLKLGKIEYQIPTIGYNLETIQNKKFEIISWDIGGADKIRILWINYLQKSQGIIYVIDCFDKERMDQAKTELHKMLLELVEQPLLIFANKQDLVKMNPEELVVELAMQNYSKNWHIQPCCSSTGEGLQEGLNWMEEQLQLQLK